MTYNVLMGTLNHTHSLLVGQPEWNPACKMVEVGLLVVAIWSFSSLITPLVTTHHIHHPQLQ